MNHIHYDKCPENSDQVHALYANAAMGKTTEPTVTDKQNFKELSYTKSYSGWQRAGRLCEGLFLSFISGGFGLIDLRVRHKFTAAFEGKVEKKVFIDDAIYKKALSELDGSSAYGLAFRAEVLLKMGQIDEAIKSLQEATEKDPSNAFAVGLLGEAYRLKNLTKKNLALSPDIDSVSGREQLQQSIKLEPKNAFAHARLGALYRHTASFYANSKKEPDIKNYSLFIEKAKESLQTAIDLNPNDIFAHKEVALLLRHEGDITGALAHIQKAYDLDRAAFSEGRPRVMTFEDKISLIEISVEACSKGLSIQVQQPLRTVINELLIENENPSREEYHFVGNALKKSGIASHQEEADGYLAK